MIKSDIALSYFIDYYALNSRLIKSMIGKSPAYIL